MTAIAVTGSHGFVGSALAAHLEQRDVRVVRIDRAMLKPARRADLAGALSGCAVVIHCAGLTPRRRRPDSDADFDEANHQSTRNLALAARDAAVPRLVFVSSLAVVAGAPSPLAPETPTSPIGAYGRSKALAEQALLATEGMQSLILRPPLVYGAGAGGDVNLLLKLCAMPIPLPFGAVDNRRSMVAISNLVDALHFLATARLPDDASRILHVADGEDLSLRQIVELIRAGMGRRANLWPIPPGLLRTALASVGLRNASRRLLDDLVVDFSSLTALGWHPPARPERDLKRMAMHMAGAVPAN